MRYLPSFFLISVAGCSIPISWTEVAELQEIIKRQLMIMDVCISISKENNLTDGADVTNN